MFCKEVWLTVCALLLAEAAASAQWAGPTNPGAPSIFGNSGGIGYPAMQYNPAGPATAPNIPYGFAPPNSPFVNPGPMGAMPSVGGPAYDGVGPKVGASEPYVVPREDPPAKANPISQPTPAPFASHPPIEAPVNYEPACYVQAVPPSEPYALYEGPRYAAEVKVEETRVWVQASYIHWWVNRSVAPPLITTGSVTDPMPGALGQPNTSILLGNGPIGPTEFSGVQASVGMWLDPEKTHAFELAGFYLGKNSRQYSVSSDANGNPFLAQPLFITGVGGGESGLVITQPGISAGSIHLDTNLNFLGAEANWIFNAYRLNGWTFDYFAGIRYLYLDDNLALSQNITVLPGGVGFPFNANPAGAPAGANVLLSDSFNVTNRFYGGQIGARVNWTACNWELGAILKLGLGATRHTVEIDGASTLIANGAITTVPGGVLAQASNIGQHTSTDFSVVPELTLTASYQFTPWFRVLAGYNLIYWTDVERAANQIDRRIDATQAPTSPTFVPGAVGTNPLFPNIRSDFWAQGLNLGMEFKF